MTKTEQEAARAAELIKSGAALERKEDSHGDTRKGWWIDDVFLGSDSKTALESVRG